MDREQVFSVIQILASYIVPTLKVFVFTLLFSVPLGIVTALLKKCRFKPIAWLVNLYILIMRGTPLMLQIIAIYYAVPYLKLIEGLPGFVKKFAGLIDIRRYSEGALNPYPRDSTKRRKCWALLLFRRFSG